MNSNKTNPRGNLVNDLLKSVQLKDNATARENGEDRFSNTILDGYISPDEIGLIVRHFWSRNDVVGLRTNFLFLACHAMLLRGESVRMLQISDLAEMMVKSHTNEQSQYLVFLMKQGKVNQTGKARYVFAKRHKKVALCVVSSLAFYLLHRFTNNEDVGVFMSDSANWQDIRVAPGNDRMKDLDYKSQHTPTKMAFRSAGIHSKKITHAGRKSGAMTCELNGVEQEQIKRLGNWNSDVLNVSYLSPLPEKAVHVMAGFSTSEPYKLTREALAPPSELCQQIFPWLEDIKNKMSSGAIENTLNRVCFVRLMTWLRVVIIQDAVELQDMFPEADVFQLPVFKSQEFLMFKQQLKSRMAAPIETVEQGLQQVLSEVAQGFREFRETFVRIESTIAGFETSVGHKLSALGSDSKTQERSLLEIQKGIRSFMRRGKEFFADMSNDLEHTFGEQAHSNVDTEMDLNPSAVSEAPICTSNGIPKYRMCTGSTTVPLLAAEWFEGLVDRPSIDELMDKYKLQWLPDDAAKRWFRRRRKVIDVVVAYVEKNQVSIDEAAQCLEQFRLANRCHINKLSDIIQEFCDLENL